VGESEVEPALLVIANESLHRFTLGGKNFAFLLDLRDTPRVLMADPLNVDSLFTRLFFLDGAYTTAFEKFSDTTSFNMGRILIWKVDWSRLEALGLA